MAIQPANHGAARGASACYGVSHGVSPWHGLPLGFYSPLTSDGGAGEDKACKNPSDWTPFGFRVRGIRV